MAKFKPGQKANPNGRPKGTPDWRTKIARALQADLPALLERTKALALAGDVQALRLLLERTLPPAKAHIVPVELPELVEAKTLTAKADAVLAAVGRGGLPPDVGAQLLASLGQAARVFETDELERRIRALEERRP